MNLVPIDSSTPPQELVWAMPRTFFGSPSVPDLDELDAQVAFLGVPWDAGTPQPGTAQGPAAARMKSSTATAGTTWRPTATTWSA